MYIVYDDNGDIVNAIDDIIEKQGIYYCPLCKERVIYKKGKKISSHFAHCKNSECKITTYKRESKEHLQVKENLYKHFKSKYKNVKLEHTFKINDSLQIADIYIADINLAFEYQRSIIPYEELSKRTNGYKKAGIKLIWLIDTNKFVTELKVQNNIVYMRYAPFVDNFLNYHKGCIFFYGYNREKEEVEFYQIWSHNFKKRNAIAKKFSIKLKNLNLPINFKFFKENLLTKIYKKDKENYIYTQLKYDKTVKNKVLSKLYNLEIKLNDIPNFIGVNINEQLLIDIPLFLWQLEIYKLFKEGRNYNEVMRYMLSYLKLKNTIFITNEEKNKIALNIISWYYKLLLGEK